MTIVVYLIRNGSPKRLVSSCRCDSQMGHFNLINHLDLGSADSDRYNHIIISSNVIKDDFRSISRCNKLSFPVQHVLFISSVCGFHGPSGVSSNTGIKSSSSSFTLGRCVGKYEKIPHNDRGILRSMLTWYIECITDSSGVCSPGSWAFRSQAIQLLLK